MRVETYSPGVMHITLDAATDRQVSVSSLRQLSQALEQATSLAGTHCIVVSSEADVFMSGPNYAALDDVELTQAIRDIASQIDTNPCPVIMAIQGAVLGAGIDIVLAAHGRWGGPNARFRYANMRLGIMPCGGATQRLPRLVGPGAAMNILALGKSIDAEEAARIGLCDVVTDDPVDAALQVAQSPEQSNPPLVQSRLRKSGLTQPLAFQNVIAKARATAAGDHVSGRLIDCIEAAQILPFETGVAYEAAAAEECQNWPAGRARRHILFAETRLSALGNPTAFSEQFVAFELEAEAALPWALACLAKEMCVGFSNLQVQRYVQDVLTTALNEGQLGRAEYDAQIALICERPLSEANVVLVPAQDALPPWTQSLGSQSMVLAISEDRSMPQLQGAPSEPVVGTLLQVGQTSGVPVFEVAFQDPADAKAGPKLCQFLRQLGRLGVVLETRQSGVGSAVWGACVYAARQMAKLGVDPAAIDQALKDRGFDLLPFGGHRPPLPNPSQTMHADEILTRCLDAMANAGALLLDAKVVRNPADIDLVAVRAFGVPLDIGGPMFWADQSGLLGLRKRISNRLAEAPEFWQAAPLLDVLIKNGQRFEDLI